MKTLLLYFSNNSTVRDFCDNSEDKNVDVVEIFEKYYNGFLWDTIVGSYRAIAGHGTHISETGIDLSSYDSIILATSMQAFCVPAAVNDFLHSNNLQGMDVYGMLFGKALFGVAADSLHQRIGLSGGNCKGVVCVPERELKKNAYSVPSLLRTRALADK